MTALDYIAQALRALSICQVEVAERLWWATAQDATTGARI